MRGSVKVDNVKRSIVSPVPKHNSTNVNESKANERLPAVYDYLTSSATMRLSFTET